MAALLLGLACERYSPQEPEQSNQPADSTEIFLDVFKTPEKCQTCHPNHYSEWQTSMHAYSFVDPIFFKLNSIGQTRSNNQLDQFCIKCHSPFATLLKEAPPGFDPSQISELSKKGVQCDVCHTMKKFKRGKSVVSFYLDDTRRGPITDPMPNSFHESEFDARYAQSNICSACHDVIAPSGERIEETSTEWDNSPYLAMGLECQNCHMPTYSGQAAVGGPARDNLHRHYFVGVDIPLVPFPGRQNTIQMVDDLLKNSVTMTVDLPAGIPANDDLEINVTINNDKTGHKVPSGNIFERQMWLEVTVTDPAADTIVYQSGNLDANQDLLNQHSEFVANGNIPEDVDLTIFNGTAYDDGEETLFFWEADSVKNTAIPPFETRTAQYLVTAPFSANELEINVRLRFRSFPPYLLRNIGEENLIPNLEIFEMSTFNQTIPVTP